jgi:hypothetical protein
MCVCWKVLDWRYCEILRLCIYIIYDRKGQWYWLKTRYIPSLFPWLLLSAGNTTDSMKRINFWDANSYTVSQEVLRLCESQRLITVFTKFRQLFLSWAIWIQSTTSCPVSLGYILLLFSYIRLVYSFLQDVQPKFCTNFSSLSHVLHVPPISSSLLSSP